LHPSSPAPEFFLYCVIGQTALFFSKEEETDELPQLLVIQTRMLSRQHFDAYGEIT
jgi:hypothetical protein